MNPVKIENGTHFSLYSFPKVRKLSAFARVQEEREGGREKKLYARVCLYGRLKI